MVVPDIYLESRTMFKNLISHFHILCKVLFVYAKLMEQILIVRTLKWLTLFGIKMSFKSICK